MTDRKRIIKSIVTAGAVLGGIDVFQDCGAVYAAEMETAEQDDVNEILTELEMEATVNTYGSMVGGESILCGKAMEDRVREGIGTERKGGARHRLEALETEEWHPTHGYRGCGSWKITRKAVENACANEGLELSGEELDEGTDIWFYSGVTLQYYNTQYGSGWNAFAAWFERISGEKVPNFGEEEMMAIEPEEMPPLRVKAE